MELFYGITTASCLLFIVSLILAYFLYMTWNYGIFKSANIPGPTPIPPFGNVHSYLTKGIRIMDLEWIRKYGNIFGIYEGRNPRLVVADPQLMKEILVKDFSSFTDRRNFKFSGVFSDALTQKTGDDWYRVRKILTPTFSAGKLKQMIHLINIACDNLVENFEEKAQSGESIELKDYCGAYTMDVIASTAFGLQIDSRRDPENPFVKHAKIIFGSVNISSPMFMIAFLAPFLLPLVRLLRINFLPRTVSDFFGTVIRQLMKQRKGTKEKYADFFQLMLNANIETESETQSKNINSGETKEKGNMIKGLTESEILSQSVLFFAAGYDTTATTISFTLFKLAENPRCQQKAIEEIDCQEELNYDTIQKLLYLEMCIMESLRIFPPAIRFDRVATRDTSVCNIKITKGMNIVIPVFAIHHDPNIWDNPEDYRPERFATELKSQINPFHHIPFGYGRRNCIGMRLALVEAKMALARVLKRFTVTLSGETSLPLQFDEFSALLRPKEGLYIQVHNRT